MEHPPPIKARKQESCSNHYAVAARDSPGDNVKRLLLGCVFDGRGRTLVGASDIRVQPADVAWGRLVNAAWAVEDDFCAVDGGVSKGHRFLSLLEQPALGEVCSYVREVQRKAGVCVDQIASANARGTGSQRIDPAYSPYPDPPPMAPTARGMVHSEDDIAVHIARANAADDVQRLAAGLCLNELPAGFGARVDVWVSDAVSGPEIALGALVREPWPAVAGIALQPRWGYECWHPYWIITNALGPGAILTAVLDYHPLAAALERWFLLTYAHTIIPERTRLDLARQMLPNTDVYPTCWEWLAKAREVLGNQGLVLEFDAPAGVNDPVVSMIIHYIECYPFPIFEHDCAFEGAVTEARMLHVLQVVQGQAPDPRDFLQHDGSWYKVLRIYEDPRRQRPRMPTGPNAAVAAFDAVVMAAGRASSDILPAQFADGLEHCSSARVQTPSAGVSLGAVSVRVPLFNETRAPLVAPMVTPARSPTPSTSSSDSSLRPVMWSELSMEGFSKEEEQRRRQEQGGAL
jgi:hypothetical protein